MSRQLFLGSLVIFTQCLQIVSAATRQAGNLEEVGYAELCAMIYERWMKEGCANHKPFR